MKGDDAMTAISVTKARENIYQILSDVNTNCQPITITNNRGKNGVLISEDDWNAIQETLYLNSIPGVAESIVEGGNTPLKDCLSEDEVEW
jgi:prevent-host-death family protein